MATGNDDESLDNDPTQLRPKPRLVRSIADEPTAAVDEIPLKPFPSRWRRMGPILAVLVGVLAMGPFISRFIDTYRAVVMDIDAEQGRMMIQQSRRPPKWISAIDAAPGAVIVKEAFTWNPRVTEPLAKDAPELELAQRWRASYEGVIIEMRPPVAPGRGQVAVVETKNGEHFEVSLFAEHLATASVGRVLHKDPSTWDPYLLPVSRTPSGSFSLTPEGAKTGQKVEMPKTD